MCNDQLYEAAKKAKPNSDLSHITDSASKLDVMLSKFKLRQGTFEKLVFEEIAKFKDAFTLAQDQLVKDIQKVGELNTQHILKFM